MEAIALFVGILAVLLLLAVFSLRGMRSSLPTRDAGDDEALNAAHRSIGASGFDMQ